MSYNKRPSSMSPVYVRSKVVGVTVYERIEGKGYLEVHVYYMGAEVVAEITITTLEGILIGNFREILCSYLLFRYRKTDCFVLT